MIEWKNGVSVSDAGQCKCGSSAIETKEFQSLGCKPVHKIIIDKTCKDCGYKSRKILRRNQSGFDLS